MTRRAATAEVEAWQRDGWVLLEGLVPVEEIDAAAAELSRVFPTPDEYHDDPAGTIERWLGRPATDAVHRANHGEPDPPPEGRAFRNEQFRWRREFPFPLPGVLNRLCVHPAIVDFAERALGSADLRVYQTQLSAKYTGEANYEQPLHTDRNHSWMPLPGQAPWWHLEGFLYLSDVTPGVAPTHLVSVGDTPPTTKELVARFGELYDHEQAAVGPRGSYLAYRPDVFHRAVDLSAPRQARFLLNVSYKIAGQDWIGYHTAQSRCTGPEWTAFVEASTPDDLALFGWPEPGHPIWTPRMLRHTGWQYPSLNLQPWYDALAAEGET